MPPQSNGSTIAVRDIETIDDELRLVVNALVRPPAANALGVAGGCGLQGPVA